MSTAGLHDYCAIGINPANIGFGSDRVVALGSYQGAFSIHSKALTNSDINITITSGSPESLTAELRQNYSETFVNEGLSFDIDVLLAGVAIEPSAQLAIGLLATLKNIIRVRLNDFASD